MILTAYDTPELVTQASQVGAGAYLLKPPNAQDMERAIIIAMARFQDMVALRDLNLELQSRNAALEEALAQVKLLSGMLPICASCKKIRDDEGYWQQIELYIQQHSEAEFSHGICPPLYAGALSRSLRGDVKGRSRFIRIRINRPHKSLIGKTFCSICKKIMG